MKIKQLICRCNVVEDIYPNNFGDFRIAECIKCKRKHIVDLKNKKVYHVKNYKNIYILEKVK